MPLFSLFNVKKAGRGPNSGTYVRKSCFSPSFGHLTEHMSARRSFCIIRFEPGGLREKQESVKGRILDGILRSVSLNRIKQDFPQHFKAVKILLCYRDGFHYIFK